MDVVADYVKDWLDDEEDETVKTQVTQVINICNHNNYPMQHTPVRQYSKENASFFYPINKGYQEETNDTLFIPIKAETTKDIVLP